MMSRRLILIVDDEPNLRDSVRSILEASGYRASSACCGEEGLKKADEEHPDLILLDVVMPDINGLEVLHRLRNNPKTESIPVVMLSVKGDTDFLFKAERLRATDYIIKPFDSQELLKLVGRYIAIHDIQEEDATS